MQSGLRQLTPREQAIINRYSAQHGRVVGLEAPIADSAGGIGMPLLRLGTLARLERRGAITPAEAAAGERFHALFQKGGLDGLRAADVSRVPVAAGTAVAGDISPSNERCRRRVAEALLSLGGHGSVAASAIWHIIGLEWTTRRWAITVRRSKEEACGILIGALAALAAHFAGGRRTRPR
jgi:hypothetical protein